MEWYGISDDALAAMERIAEEMPHFAPQVRRIQQALFHRKRDIFVCFLDSWIRSHPPYNTVPDYDSDASSLGRPLADTHQLSRRGLARLQRIHTDVSQWLERLSSSPPHPNMPLESEEPDEQAVQGWLEYQRVLAAETQQEPAPARPVPGISENGSDTIPIPEVPPPAEASGSAAVPYIPQGVLVDLRDVPWTGIDTIPDPPRAVSEVAIEYLRKMSETIQGFKRYITRDTGLCFSFRCDLICLYLEDIRSHLQEEGRMLLEVVMVLSMLRNEIGRLTLDATNETDGDAITATFYARRQGQQLREMSADPAHRELQPIYRIWRDLQRRPSECPCPQCLGDIFGETSGEQGSGEQENSGEQDNSSDQDVPLLGSWPSEEL